MIDFSTPEAQALMRANLYGSAALTSACLELQAAYLRPQRPELSADDIDRQVRTGARRRKEAAWIAAKAQEAALPPTTFPSAAAR